MPPTRLPADGAITAYLFHRPGVANLVVGVAALATYIMTVGYDFAFDDYAVIPVGWQFGTVGAREVVHAPVRADTVVLPYFRPAVALSYWLDGYLWHGNPGGFHLTNLLLHATVSVLVLAIARRLLPAGPGPLVAGLLFAVHPIHVEAVAWIQGRVDLLSAAGVLVALVVGLAGEERAGKRKLLYWAASATVFFFALLAKEVAVVMPLLLAVVLVGQPDRGRWSRLRDNGVLFAILGMTFVLYLGLRTAALGTTALGLAGGPPLADRVLLALRVIPVYVHLLVWPVSLNPKHAVAPPSGFLDGAVLLGAALVMLAGAIGVVLGRRVPGIGSGLAWLALAWLPMSNLVPIAAFVVAERYLYLPSAGFCIAVGGVTAALPMAEGRRRAALTVGVLALTVTLAGLSVAHAELWRNPLTFYEGLVLRNPNSALAHSGLGAVYLDLGDEARAEERFRKAVELHPGHTGALNNLGILAQRRGNLAEARRLYRKALVARPYQAEVWNNLGTVSEIEGDLTGAIAAYTQAVRLDPETPRFLANLAGALSAQGQRDEAKALLERAVALDPTSPQWREALQALQAGDRTR